LVEQNLPMALSVADYVYVISKGMIVHESIPKELRDNEELTGKYLGVTIKTPTMKTPTPPFPSQG
jgi:branched-chain amino acid transport system ATP-binding protein